MSSGHYSIDHELADFLEANAAMLVAASDKANKPTITRGFGARVTDDRLHITVFVGVLQSAAMLEDIEQTGRVCLNATRISDYESVQLKGKNAQINKLSREDLQHIERYLPAVQSEMENIGLPPLVANNIYKCREHQGLVGITFKLEEVFSQTPGPGAGKRRYPRP